MSQKKTSVKAGSDSFFMSVQ